ncbi:MAG TPA: glycine betaine ABC transporter substrate-binding protein [Verrucomicrobiae bacterium]|jgi:osmoprotectant transport system substrate-binding protein|nr:glycine betaine ABC transporter substrate-binding protein [Verrucomicrobiae bacterium]
MRRLFSLILVVTLAFATSCHAPKPQIVIGSKFFTEQVVLAELLAQHIEARTGIHVQRKTNLGGTLLVHKAMQAGQVDLYVEYTGTALNAVLNESPTGDSSAVYQRVKQLYGERFNFEVTEPLGFENTFAMVIRGEDARQVHLQRMSDLVPIAPKWRVGVGFEFLERADGFRGWSERYGLHFVQQPSVMDLGLIYRALQDHKVDIVAGNSTDGVIDSLHLVILKDDRHYFPPYDAVPIVRRATLEKFSQLRGALAELSGKISGQDMRHLNYLVDGEQRDVARVVREYRQSHNL